VTPEPQRQVASLGRRAPMSFIVNKLADFRLPVRNGSWMFPPRLSINVYQLSWVPRTMSRKSSMRMMPPSKRSSCSIRPKLETLAKHFSWKLFLIAIFSLSPYYRTIVVWWYRVAAPPRKERVSENNLVVGVALLRLARPLQSSTRPSCTWLATPRLAATDKF
jgi:hypothetical protein